MINFKFRLTLIFASNNAGETLETARAKIQIITKEPFSLFTGQGTDGETAEPVYMFIQFTQARPEAIRTAEAIRRAFKQKAVLFETIKSDAGIYPSK